MSKDPAPLAAAPPSQLDAIVGGRYRLTQLLGSGGMGEVYAAEHLHITKRVAIKLLHPEIRDNAEALSRFKQEAQAASSIGHEAIVRIDDFFELEDGRVCLCMEYLEGQSLDQLFHGTPPLDPARGVELLCQVCAGLAAAHAKGIVHRDMKPENVFVTTRPDGAEQVKILDFGIAKVLSNDGNSLTKTGTVFGTPNYMSPEQALGHRVDARADVYSVGVMLFELYTGDVPFKAESFMGVLSQHITKPPPVPSTLRPGQPVPDGIEAIILQALAKEPAERFPDIEALAHALRPFRRPAAARTRRVTPAPEELATRIGAASPLAPVTPAPMPAPAQPPGRPATAPREARPAVPPTVRARPAGSSAPPDLASPHARTASAGLTALPQRRGPRALAALIVLGAVIVLAGLLVVRWWPSPTPAAPRATTPPPEARPAAAPSAAGAQLEAGQQASAASGATSDRPPASAATTTAGPHAPDAAAPRPAATAAKPASSPTPSAPVAAGDGVPAAPDGAAGRPTSSRDDSAGGHAPTHSPVDDGPSSTPAPDHRPPARRSAFTLRIVSTPDDAAVFRDGRRLSERTPLTLELRPGERTTLTFAKGGWLDRTLTVVGREEDQTVRITLRRRGWGNTTSEPAAGDEAVEGTEAGSGP